MPMMLCVPIFSGSAQGNRPRHAGAVPALQAHGPARGQQGGELGHAGLEVVVHPEQVALGGLDLALPRGSSGWRGF
jgi:hypothetical protein